MGSILARRCSCRRYIQPLQRHSTQPLTNTPSPRTRPILPTTPRKVGESEALRPPPSQCHEAKTSRPPQTLRSKQPLQRLPTDFTIHSTTHPTTTSSQTPPVSSAPKSPKAPTGIHPTKSSAATSPKAKPAYLSNSKMESSM